MDKLDQVKATFRTTEITDDDVLTMVAVHVTPRIVAVVVSAVKDENGRSEAWHIAVTEGGEITGNMLVSDRNLFRALSEMAA